MIRGNQVATRTNRRQGGYTIVEILIFLAVSAVMFVSAMIALSGRQNTVQFTNVVRDFESQLLDVANDVSNGYFQANAQLTCDNALAVTNSGSAATKGSNKDCVVLGRVLKFGDGTDSGKYDIASIVGRRVDSDDNDVRTLAQATPRMLLVNDDVSQSASLVQSRQVGYGSKIACVKRGADNCDPLGDRVNNAAVAFVTKLSGGAQGGVSGSTLTADIATFSDAKIADSLSDIKGLVNDSTKYSALAPSAKLTICLQSGTGKQYALVRMTNGRVLSEIKNVTGSQALCS